MLVDLNVPWPQKSYDTKPSAQDLDQLKRTLTTLHALGYTHVALNFTVPHSTSFPKASDQINPINLAALEDVRAATGLRLYTRLTLVVDDPARGQALGRVAAAFDIVAALPVSERGLALAAGGLDVDLLTFQYGQRLPALLKHKTVCGCVRAGLKIEIVYAHALRDVPARRSFVVNCKTVIRAARARGLVVSSGARGPLECRNILGVAALLRHIGLKDDRCSRAMRDLASLALLNGRLRSKSYRHTVVVAPVPKRPRSPDAVAADNHKKPRDT
ncbi:AaceriAAL046Cp [[Ashbya] aceris (nom. inval.)]|nr:AaceriAAL046Cp [[Ashbya] aceris (nom. inval.)]